MLSLVLPLFVAFICCLCLLSLSVVFVCCPTHCHISRVPVSSCSHYCGTLLSSSCIMLQTQSTSPNFSPMLLVAFSKIRQTFQSGWERVSGWLMILTLPNFSDWLRTGYRMADDGGGRSSSEMEGWSEDGEPRPVCHGNCSTGLKIILIMAMSLIEGKETCWRV